MSPDEKEMQSCPQCGSKVTGLERECPICGKKFDNSVKFECPFCGELVFPGATSCPGCHIDFTKIDIGRFVNMSKPAQGKSVDDNIDQMLGELQKFMKTETKMKSKRLICLNCAESLDGSQEICPGCKADLTKARSIGCPNCKAWVTLEDDFCPDCHSDLTAAEKEPIVHKTRQLRQTSPVMTIADPKAGEPQAQCSSCGNLVGIKDAACPFCGVQFEGVELEVAKPSAPKASPKPPTETPIVPGGRARRLKSVDQKPHITTPAPIRSQVSKLGFSNGIGETNGLSFVNGKRTPDGSSFVNGTGVSNGLKLSRMGASSKTVGRLMTNWRFLTVLVAISVVIPTFVYVSYSQGGSPYTIDGKFNDWKDSTKLGARTLSSVQSINVHEWSVEIHDLGLYLYAKTESNLMERQNVESVFLYVDSDDSSSTGYPIDQLGADYLLEIDGWNSSVQSTSLSTYSSTTDRMDWNSWRNIGGLAVSLGGNQIEAMASLQNAMPSSARFLLVAQDDQERFSSSYDVPAKGGLLIVQQVVPDNVSATGVIPQEAGTVLLSLVFTCEGAEGSVQNISPELSGVSEAASIPAFSIQPGTRHVADVQVDATALQAGQLATALVKGSDISSSFTDVQVIGAGARAYVMNPPKRIVIDGAFGDWTGRTVHHNGSAPVSNPNLKIDDVGAANDSAGAYFYVSVEGQMCSGTYVPAIRVRPSGTQGGGVIVMPQRKTAEDVMRVFIDSDRSPSTGMQVALDSGSPVIGADQLIEIRGLFGKITSGERLGYVSGDWVSQINTVEAAIDNHQMEIGVGSASFGPSTLVDFVIQTTSWRGPEDIATSPVRDLSQDPWAMRTTGADYRSSDGATWSAGSTITLSGGDTVIDMAPSWDKQYVFAVTNSGRVYSWQVGVSTTWGSNVTDTVNGTANIVAIAPFDFSVSSHGGFILASDGRLWSTNKLDGTQKAWTYGNKVADGITDFADIEYQKTGKDFYVIRSASNTAVYVKAGVNWNPTAATGSTSPQTHILHVGASKQTDERILVLCENGNIRDSSDGGATWSARGNLPVPGGSNTSKYIGMDFDPSGYLWAITDSGWCYKSTDTTTFNSFTYTGRATSAGGVTAITAPIPEFPQIVVPVVFVLGMMLVLWSRPKKRNPALGHELMLAFN
jgi:RNA polymerase subunit RPABC4/transcription elongation factor Spt4